MKKNKFKFEVSFHLNTRPGEKLDKLSIKQFEIALYDWVNNYAGEEGCFYTYSKDRDGEVVPTHLQVKKVPTN